uniref:Crumbs cell polarity complex component 1 n=1 Tax=Myripristis murdjan TaxID=586833 RepID=A0A667YWA4_9TELE
DRLYFFYYPTAFLGCFRDVFVDSHLVVPVARPAESDAQANITVGCSNKDKCDDNPCQNRGRCVSQGWRSYMCECHRPYEGADCAEEYITARFGNKGLESYAVFSLDDHPGDTVVVSMFIRTRQSSGLLLVLANSTGQYLRLWLEGGRVKVQVNNFETLVGRGLVNDGHFHLVTVKMEGGATTLFQSAQNQGSIRIRHVQAHPGDLVYVGGLPNPRASASFGGYFKGCVQDLRINSKRLQFYPIPTSVASYSLDSLINITQGCSSDNACTVNPCLNGGVCYSMWDDFICNCPPNTAGQRCEEVKWCELSPCPSTAVCQPRSQGFECECFGLNSCCHILSYRGNGKIKRSLSSVFLSLRTRQPDAMLLHGQKASDYLTISLQDSHLLMEVKAEDSPKLTIQTPGPICDGEWHTIELSMKNQNLQRSRWIMVLDGGKEGFHMSDVTAGNLDFLKEEVDIVLGGLGLDAGGNLIGCLGPVEIGGLLLPFHGDTELNLPRPQEEQFVRINDNVAPRYGCWGASVCTPNPCQNRGVCEDLFDLYHCTCPSRWAGPRCQDPADTCASSPCVHGNCNIIPGGYKCACEAGYTGARCEVEVDMCAGSNCSKGSTCLRGIQSYACLCPQNLTGQYCEFPTLPVSLCRGTRWNYSCFNGGSCSDVDNTCHCLPGFAGQWYALCYLILFITART